MLLKLIAVIVLEVLAVLAVVATIYVGVGLALMRMRCPECRNKGLKLVNSFFCNPPPSYSFFACDHCGGQFVQVQSYGGAKNPMIPRAGSPWEHKPEWETPIPSDRRRRNIS
jgi:hypothetical protein